MNERLDHIQLALFSPGIIILDKLKVASAINDNLLGLFDGDSIILPIPEDAPPEFPRIQMNSKDGRYSLVLAKGRLDFIFRNKEDESEVSLPVPGIFEKFLTIFQYFKENIHAQITRYAIVTNWIIELEKVAVAEFLLSKYIRSETPITKPYELELHYLNKESIAEFKVNNWTRIKSMRKISEPEQNWFINFNLDINTLSELAYEMNKESLRRFLEESWNFMKETLKNHSKIWS